MNNYLEILKRCKKQGIDTKNCHVYLKPNHLDGELCLEGTISQDGLWMCIPTKKYNYDFDDYIYVPECYEIKEKFTTYLKGDSVWYLVEGYLLYKRK